MQLTSLATNTPPINHPAARPRRFLTVLVLLVATLPAAAGERPFHGRIEGEVVTRPTEDPAIYVGGATAAGHGTHVGFFTKVTSDVTNVFSGFTVGSFTMTAADGDLLTGVYEGITLFDLPSSSLSWVLDATITGGTGRFADATGTFEFIAEGEFFFSDDGTVTTIYSETFDGSIDY